uniref:Uncharacterized protein n=1 Tax=Ackermannviridae sp. TaxID=2831612 RepID=A0A8S5RTV6_9CAUD|nr:MAG TPA: hypothetical protein [Ackermannviridae sp.]
MFYPLLYPCSKEPIASTLLLMKWRTDDDKPM